MSRKLLLVSLLLTAPCWGRLPDLGHPETLTLKTSEEAQLGRIFLRELRHYFAFIEDLEIQDYITNLGRRLAGQTGEEQRRFHFFVVKDPQINAFAGPAGYIGVHSGLILATKDESELAAVLAHETAHVIQRHLQQAIAERYQMALPLLAATLAAAILASQSPKAAQAALIALQAGGVQHQISFTREHEEEADAIGLQILQTGGFDPTGMPRFFQRLAQFAKLSPKPPPFLRTHPVSTERFVNTFLQLPSKGRRQSSLRYELVKAKLLVLTSPVEKAESHFRAQLKKGGPFLSASARYGLALLAEKRGDRRNARRILKGLLQEFPYEVAIVHALSRTEDLRESLERYRHLLEIFPTHRLLRLHYAQVLLKKGHYRQAETLLLAEKDFASEWPMLYKLLAQATRGLGNDTQAELYLAHHSYGIGDLREAISHLRSALKGLHGSKREEVKRLLKKWQEEWEKEKSWFKL